LAAQQVIASLGLTQALAGKRVIGENISQAYQFVTTGNAELGFVAMSQVLVDGELVKGSLWRVPQHLHSPIAQDAVLLTRSLNNSAAHEFMTFLESAKAVSILHSFGYSVESDAVGPVGSVEKTDG
jgi:molybdate transport system substrate-binding protein